MDTMAWSLISGGQEEAIQGAVALLGRGQGISRASTGHSLPVIPIDHAGSASASRTARLRSAAWIGLEILLTMPRVE